ncbi:MAG: periplasmic divalent cation tolerance protein-like protein [Ramlibacter sp.]|nr:periplasmic divalent cation tolerance protein-like protein [Ramlibacter sp.]
MEDCQEADILSVTTTVGSRRDADALARVIVERRLAACVQLEDGLQSFYRWDGQLCEDSEARLVIRPCRPARPPCRRSSWSCMPMRCRNSSPCA